MKKYIEPQIEVVKIETSTILAGSPELGKQYDGQPTFAPALDDEDEY